MNSKEKPADLFYLPKVHEQATMKHPGPGQTRTIEEIVGSVNLGLSLRNPYYELFRRHKAPIVNGDGTVYCAQKANIVDHVPANLPVFCGESSHPVISGSYSNPLAIEAAMGVPENPNPNPNSKGRLSVLPSAHINVGQTDHDQLVPSRHYNCSVARGPDQALAGSGRGAKRGRWVSAAGEEAQRPGKMAANGDRVEADNDENIANHVSVIDLSLKLGPPN